MTVECCCHQELGKNWKTLEHEDMAEREVRREERRVGVKEGDTDDSNRLVQQSLFLVHQQFHRIVS